MDIEHTKTLETFWKEHKKDVNFLYQDVFDPMWLVEESHWPFFKLSALDNQPWAKMHNEAESLLESFHDHRDDYGYGWKSLTIHGLDDDTQTLDSYGDRDKVIKQLDWTWVADKGPTVKTFLKDVWPMEYLNRVRFMLLEPGGYILPHQDRDAKEKRLSVCNIALNNPDDCEFIFKDHGVVPFQDKGGAFLMDISNVHAVWNKSDVPRIHMIIHGEVGRRLRDMFYVLRQSYYTNRG